MIVIAIEGVGGSGKSAVLESLRKSFQDRQLNVAVWKMGGLGDTQRERTLKQIIDYREQLVQKGGYTEKQYRDKERDRIFRIAIRYQARRFGSFVKTSSPDLVLFDRTPFMSWVYAKARDPLNPYLCEIWEEAAKICNLLDLKHVFLLDVDPTIAFARLIARAALEHKKTVQEIYKTAVIEGLSKSAESTILEKASQMVAEGAANKKPLARWDYIPWQVMAAQCSLYRQIFGDASRSPIATTPINAEVSLTEVCSAIEKEIVLRFIDRNKTGLLP